MTSAERQKPVQKAARWPCGVCGRGVGSNSIQCVDGDADTAVEARIRIGWNKFRHLVPLLTNRDISLIRRGRLYSSCV